MGWKDEILETHKGQTGFFVKQDTSKVHITQLMSYLHYWMMNHKILLIKD